MRAVSWSVSRVLNLMIIGMREYMRGMGKGKRYTRICIVRGSEALIVPGAELAPALDEQLHDL